MRLRVGRGRRQRFCQPLSGPGFGPLAGLDDGWGVGFQGAFVDEDSIEVRIPNLAKSRLLDRLARGELGLVAARWHRNSMLLADFMQGDVRKSKFLGDPGHGTGPDHLVEVLTAQLAGLAHDARSSLGGLTGIEEQSSFI